MQQNITKSAMLNGLIIGCFLSIKFILSAQKGSFLPLMAFAISISIIFILYNTAIRFRDTICEGVIEYRQAYTYIFKIYVYGSIISSLTMLIYTRFFDTSFLDLLLNQNLKFYESFHLKMDNSSVEVLSTIYRPAPFALLNLIGSVIVGGFWGLILANFVKKEKSIFDEN